MELNLELEAAELVLQYEVLYNPTLQWLKRGRPHYMLKLEEGEVDRFLLSVPWIQWVHGREDPAFLLVQTRTINYAEDMCVWDKVIEDKYLAIHREHGSVSDYSYQLLLDYEHRQRTKSSIGATEK
jgi:hypothetical protein